MPSGVKWVLAITLTMVLMASLAVGATVAAVYGGGAISVAVQERDGSDIHVAVPAGVANAALLAIDLVPAAALPLDEIPDEALDAIDHYLPAAQDALDRLAEQPDFVLVEVQSRDENVLVTKEGRHIRVVVDTDGERIDVTIPLSTVKKFTKRLRRLSREY